MNAKRCRPTTKAVYATVALLGFAALAGCAPEAVASVAASSMASRSAATLSPTSTNSPAVAVIDSSQLATVQGDGWDISPGPSVAPSGTISPQQAVAAAAREVRGEALTASSSPQAALAYITNTAPSGKTPLVQASHELVWVVQLQHVSLPISLPSSGQPSSTSDSTVQWVIDGQTGAYVEARDF